GDGLGAPHLIDVEVGHANVADLAFLLQFGQRLPALLNLIVRIGPVNLIQIDGLHAQPAQAGLALAADRVGFQAVTDPPGLVPDHAALAEAVRPVAHPFQRPRHALLAVAQAVDGRRVDPVDARVQRLVDGGDRVAVVLAAPGELPARAADGPRPEA